MRAYDFWEATGIAESSPYPIATLSLRPSNKATANDLQMMFPSDMPLEQQLAVAERVLAGVQRWRDSIAEAAARHRTAVDELAAAREEIARLKVLREDDQPRPFVPRTERSYWVDIANALNSAHSAGMPVGIDLDGTLTDHRAWSVVWDRAAEQWTVAGYDDVPAAEEQPRTVFRSSYDTEEMGLFATREAARAQCEAHERTHWLGSTVPVFRWVPDDAGDEASPEELRVSVTTYAEGSETGYVVTPLVVPSKYDEEADE